MCGSKNEKPYVLVAAAYTAALVLGLVALAYAEHHGVLPRQQRAAADTAVCWQNPNAD